MLSTYSEMQQIARECGLELRGSKLYLIGGSPCGSRRDDMRNIAMDMRKAINKYNNGKA